MQTWRAWYFSCVSAVKGRKGAWAYPKTQNTKKSKGSRQPNTQSYPVIGGEGKGQILYTLSIEHIVVKQCAKRCLSVCIGGNFHERCIFVPSAKIKTMKLSETQILACFSKICTRENYQPYANWSTYMYTLSQYQKLHKFQFQFYHMSCFIGTL